MESFEFNLRTCLVFGVGAIDRVGTISKELGLTRPLLVADKGLLEAGHVERVIALLRDAHLDVVPFHEFDVNPDSDMFSEVLYLPKVRRLTRSSAWEEVAP